MAGGTAENRLILSSILIALILPMAGAIYASHATLPKIDVDGSIEIVGDYTNGQEFEIVLHFTLRPMGRYYEMFQQQFKYFENMAVKGDSNAIRQLDYYESLVDLAFVANDPNIEFLSNRIWQGKLEPNKENTFRIRARIKEGKTTVIRGYAFYGCQLDDNTVDSISRGLMSAPLKSKVLHFEEEIEEEPKPDTIYNSQGKGSFIIQKIAEPTHIIPDSIPEIQEDTPGPQKTNKGIPPYSGAISSL